MNEILTEDLKINKFNNEKDNKINHHLIKNNKTNTNRIKKINMQKILKQIVDKTLLRNKLNKVAADINDLFDSYSIIHADRSISKKSLFPSCLEGFCFKCFKYFGYFNLNKVKCRFCKFIFCFECSKDEVDRINENKFLVCIDCHKNINIMKEVQESIENKKKRLKMMNYKYMNVNKSETSKYSNIKTQLIKYVIKNICFKYKIELSWIKCLFNSMIKAIKKLRINGMTYDIDFHNHIRLGVILIKERTLNILFEQKDTKYLLVNGININVDIFMKNLPLCILKPKIILFDCSMDINVLKSLEEHVSLIDFILVEDYLYEKIILSIQNINPDIILISGKFSFKIKNILQGNVKRIVIVENVSKDNIYAISTSLDCGIITSPHLIEKLEMIGVCDKLYFIANSLKKQNYHLIFENKRNALDFSILYFTVDEEKQIALQNAVEDSFLSIKNIYLYDNIYQQLKLNQYENSIKISKEMRKSTVKNKSDKRLIRKNKSKNKRRSCSYNSEINKYQKGLELRLFESEILKINPLYKEENNCNLIDFLFIENLILIKNELGIYKLFKNFINTKILTKYGKTVSFSQNTFVLGKYHYLLAENEKNLNKVYYNIFFENKGNLRENEIFDIIKSSCNGSRTMQIDSYSFKAQKQDKTLGNFIVDMFAIMNNICKKCHKYEIDHIYNIYNKYEKIKISYFIETNLRINADKTLFQIHKQIIEIINLQKNSKDKIENDSIFTYNVCRFDEESKCFNKIVSPIIIINNGHFNMSFAQYLVLLFYSKIRNENTYNNSDKSNFNVEKLTEFKEKHNESFVCNHRFKNLDKYFFKKNGQTLRFLYRPNELYFPDPYRYELNNKRYFESYFNMKIKSNENLIFEFNDELNKLIISLKEKFSDIQKFSSQVIKVNELEIKISNKKKSQNYSDSIIDNHSVKSSDDDSVDNIDIIKILSEINQIFLIFYKSSKNSEARINEINEYLSNNKFNFEIHSTNNTNFLNFHHIEKKIILRSIQLAIKTDFLLFCLEKCYSLVNMIFKWNNKRLSDEKNYHSLKTNVDKENKELRLSNDSLNLSQSNSKEINNIEDDINKSINDLNLLKEKINLHKKSKSISKSDNFTNFLQLLLFFDNNHSIDFIKLNKLDYGSLITYVLSSDKYRSIFNTNILNLRVSHKNEFLEYNNKNLTSSNNNKSSYIYYDINSLEFSIDNEPIENSTISNALESKLLYCDDNNLTFKLSSSNTLSSIITNNSQLDALNFIKISDEKRTYSINEERHKFDYSDKRRNRRENTSRISIFNNLSKTIRESKISNNLSHSDITLKPLPQIDLENDLISIKQNYFKLEEIYNSFGKLINENLEKSKSYVCAFSEFYLKSNEFEIIVYYPKQFESIRTAYGICYEDYLISISEVQSWSSVSGGKSNSLFFKSHDDKFILKSVSQVELDLFIDTANQYFEYTAKHIFHLMPSILCKILGVYRIINLKTREKINLFVMCNLFYGKDILKITYDNKAEFTINMNLKVYDLKGSKVKRYIKNSEIRNQTQRKVLLDTNFKEDFFGEPLSLQLSNFKLIYSAIVNDTLFLKNIDVVDYSLLLIIQDNNDLLSTNDENLDESSYLPISNIRVEIIDYIRKYTWDKQLENIGKTIINGMKEPTIINPHDYRERFLESMKNYFTGI